MLRVSYHGVERGWFIIHNFSQSFFFLDLTFDCLSSGRNRWHILTAPRQLTLIESLQNHFHIISTVFKLMFLSSLLQYTDLGIIHQPGKLDTSSRVGYLFCFTVAIYPA